MNDNQKNIDQLFKQKLENFELPSQGASWNMLQMVKQRNLWLKKVFFAKMAIGATVLCSAIVILIFSNKSPGEETLVKREHTTETTNSNDDITKVELPSIEINKITKRQTSAINPGTPLLPPLKNRTAQDRSEASHSGVAPDLEFNIREEKQLLTSESSTTYMDRVQTDKVAMRNVRKAEINSSYDEYAPVISKDGSFMFFTSRKPITDKEIRRGKGKERIYYTETDTSGWTEAQLLESPINSDKHFNSAVSLSRDGKSLFIYRDNRFGNGDLYESKLKGSKWDTPEKLPSPINSEFNESSLSLSPDGNTLFFTSDREGGFGGMDIWYSEKTKAGTWGDAKNIGNSVNSESDEEGVFMHSDGKTLYFSSRGHGGMGGYDIFYTTLENGEWTQPVNLGPEINTENDDVYFVLEDTGVDAYFTSANPNTPDKKDILKIKYNRDFHQKMSDKHYSLLKGTVLSKTDKTPVKAQVKIYDKKSNALVSTIESDAETGVFSIPLVSEKDYRIHVFKKGYLDYSEDIITDSSDTPQIILQNILLDSLRSNTRFVLIESTEFRTETALSQSVTSKLDELHQLATTNPELKLQLLLEVHSDSVLVDHQRFLDECVNYLENREPSVNRIEGRVVVNTKTLPKNSCSLWVNLTALK